MAFGGVFYRAEGGLGSQRAVQDLASQLGRRLEGPGLEGRRAGGRPRAPSEMLREPEDPEMGASNAFGGPHPKSQVESNDKGLGDVRGACDP